MRQGIMLCYPFEEKRLLKWEPPFLLQRKLDGERCRAICNRDSIRLLSSEENTFKYLPHINEALRQLDLNTVELDGELYCHEMPFSDIHGICSRKVNPHPEYARIEYHIFDIVGPWPQHERTHILEEIQLKILKKKVDEELKVVQTFPADGMETLLYFLDFFIDEGYEGFILRDRNGLYTRKRSTQIMKLKPQKEDVYEIIGTQEEVSIHGDPKDSLGAFICRGDDGTNFAVGTGPALTRGARESLWREKESLKGQYLRVKYQNLTSGRGVPRFSVAVQVLDLKPKA